MQQYQVAVVFGGDVAQIVVAPVGDEAGLRDHAQAAPGDVLDRLGQLPASAGTVTARSRA
ncbi:hypothetical protein Acsp03_54200 [Actinomadura sp. NBRC 104412]|nr:hypothetical protein Acsp03_54200 [Actinomadura sp. NBRC 104412]